MFFNWFKRKKHAKGFGIHSPFAFNLIKNIIYEKHGYNVFSDIEQMLADNNIPLTDMRLHELSYRLVRHFKPKKVFEIEIGKGINTLYISSASKDLSCRCFDPNGENVLVARNLHKHFNPNVEITDEMDVSGTYDGIFVYQNTFPISIENLLSLSSDNAFWVITGIKSGNGKRFWRKIVKDNRARVTFDMKDIGIVILNKSYNKANYLI